MRLIIIAMFVMSWLNTFGQDHYSSVQNCEELTLTTVNRLTEKFKNNELDSVDTILADWVNSCSVSEPTQRLIILNTILQKEEVTKAIQTYLEADFQVVFANRMEDAKTINYGYIYNDSKAYFGYVPLRHPIDSLVEKMSLNLLESAHLQADERLICMLFSGDIEKFEKTIKKHKYRKSFIRQYLQKNMRDWKNHVGAFSVYSGVYRPVRSTDVFGANPMVGVTISSPLKYKLVVELGTKFRLNIHDKNFNYDALGRTNSVDSKLSIFLGTMVGYKVYENNRLIILPKLGIGLEVIDTGLSSSNSNSTEEDYHNIETLHLSLGISAMTPILKKSYLGIGLNAHYCSYQWDKALQTDLDNRLLSAEIFWRF